MAIFEKLVGVPGVIIIVLVGFFVGALVILRMICEKEAESYRKAVLADLKEPKETCTLEPAEPRRAQSMYTRSAKVIVQLIGEIPIIHVGIIFYNEPQKSFACPV